MHEFVKDDRFTLIGDNGDCPYFWPIGDRYIMNFFSHMSGGQYLPGDYDKQMINLLPPLVENTIMVLLARQVCMRHLLHLTARWCNYHF